MENNNTEIKKALAKMITATCVRNTYLEELHSGSCPVSKTGDYSDVRVVTPEGDIAWNELSRINDDEMKILMKQVVNKIYTFLEKEGDQEFIDRFIKYAARFVTKWDEPKIDRQMDKI